MTKSDIEPVEGPTYLPLEDSFPHHRAIETSRGSTALALVLDHIRESSGPGEVIVPATVCPAVPLTVLFAGHQPVFCDVSPEGFVASFSEVERRITKRTVGIVVVHLFGLTCHMPRSIPNAVLIDDLAHSIGAVDESGEPLEPRKFAFLSFARKKILAGRGGLLLAPKDFRTMPASASERGYDERAEDAANERFNAFNAKARSEMPAAKFSFFSPAELAQWRRVLAPTGPGHFQPFSPATLAKTRLDRQSKYQMYMELLPPKARSGMAMFKPSEMIWRAPCLLPSQADRDRLLGEIRMIGAAASDHYFNMARHFQDDSCINADQVSLRGINFFVDDFVSASDIERICSAARRVLK